MYATINVMYGCKNIYVHITKPFFLYLYIHLIVHVYELSCILYCMCVYGFIDLLICILCVNIENILVVNFPNFHIKVRLKIENNFENFKSRKYERFMNHLYVI